MRKRPLEFVSNIAVREKKHKESQQIPPEIAKFLRYFQVRFTEEGREFIAENHMAKEIPDGLMSFFIKKIGYGFGMSFDFHEKTVTLKLNDEATCERLNDLIRQLDKEYPKEYQSDGKGMKVP